MSSLMIRDLSRTRELDRRAMSAVAGGTGSSVPGLPSVAGLSGIANVNVSVNQNLSQIQTVNVAALNNIGVIGAGFVPLNLNVSPSLWGANYANV
ncbi:MULTISPECIES: hypothetical protein [Paraburkholderia]|uniref:Uncharacterized protein n=1 Tax=Paraburkholderia madseniana TaxID=2599607 RepID=A0A6N6WBV4_9BURK|nr:MULTISPECIES: hypothetical protein [Paraburkholderia]KAE8757631.1 hypothetical protein FSO04_23025 [Paraburkholderia madseniana]MCX4149293.1 hypothetical protein [Paraburkholderia madseniana]MCX4172725.1 hypothetical protein [Paraburkholderia madseniana]MDN7152228.1 hypothetical protein [Paraburkholderia sp. WS6]MDQ6411110.1 hypothetical protein [Paraburkholderia madseniana]